MKGDKEILGDAYDNLKTRRFDGKEYILMSAWLSVDEARTEAKRLREVTMEWNNMCKSASHRCSARVTKESLLSKKWKSNNQPSQTGTDFWAVWIPIQNIENSRVFD
jgi:hypothetical protein